MGCEVACSQCLDVSCLGVVMVMMMMMMIDSSRMNYWTVP